MKHRLASLAFGLLFTGWTGAARCADDPKELARAAIQGYREHFDRFQHFRIAYEQYGHDPAAGPPKTFEDAFGLKWKKPETILRCVFVVDGTRWMLREDFDDRPFDANALVKDPENPGMAWGPAPLTERHIGNERMFLDYTPHDKRAALHDDAKGPEGSSSTRDTPLHCLGFRNPSLNPHDLLLAAEREGRPWSAGQPVEINGARCVPVTFNTVDDEKLTFYLDLNRGFVPIRIQKFGEGVDGKDEELDRTEVLGLRACSNGRWLPIKLLTLQLPGAIGVYGPALREITDFDLDRRPTKDELSIDLDAGTRIDRQSNPRAKFGVTLRQGERMSADDLARVIAISDAKQVEPLTDTAIHPRPHWPWWYYGLGGTALALVGVPLGYRRLSRSRAGRD